MKSSIHLLAAGLVLAHLSSAVPARAQAATEAPETSDTRQASKHFGLGVKLYAEGDFGPALAQFQRAYELRPHFKVLYNIAQCNFELRDYVEARTALGRYLAEGGAAVLDPDRRARIDADLAELDRRIALLEVHSNVPGAAVYVDGRKVGTTPLTAAVEVNEGKRALSVEVAAQGTKQRSILLVGGERQVVTVNFESAEERRRAPSGVGQGPAAPAQTSRLGAGFWSASIGAFVLAGGAGVTGYLAMRADGQQRADLNRPGISTGKLESDRREIRTLALATDALLGGTLICAGIATTLFVLRQTEAHPSVAVGPGHVTIGGTF